MGWADEHIAKLRANELVSFRPVGRSMEPRIRSGQLCTVEPVTIEAVDIGDIVLCTVRGMQYLHMVKDKRDGEVQIGNNKGRINGWTKWVHGRLIRVWSD
jgi:hypothetical protein